MSTELKLIIFYFVTLIILRIILEVNYKKSNLKWQYYLAENNVGFFYLFWMFGGIVCGSIYLLYLFFNL